MEEQKKKKQKKGGKRVMSVLGGTFLLREKFTKQFLFLAYVTLLLMAIITNTYIAEEKNRELTKATKRLNDLQVEYIQVKSAIMEASKQSVLVKRLEGTGLKEATEPLNRINVNVESERTWSHENRPQNRYVVEDLLGLCSCSSLWCRHHRKNHCGANKG